MFGALQTSDLQQISMRQLVPWQGDSLDRTIIKEGRVQDTRSKTKTPQATQAQWTSRNKSIWGRAKNETHGRTLTCCLLKALVQFPPRIRTHQQGGQGEGSKMAMPSNST